MRKALKGKRRNPKFRKKGGIKEVEEQRSAEANPEARKV